MSFSIIQKSQLEGAKRLDAEYYQPEYLNLNQKLKKYPDLVSLQELTEIKTGPAYASEEIGENFEIPIARIGDVTGKIDVDEWGRLSLREFKKFKSKKIIGGDILMTMTGDPPDVGKVFFIDNKNNKALAFNQRVAKLSIKSKKIENKFLFAYLNTEFSRFQAERSALGIRQRNLGIEDLKNILVIVPSRNDSAAISRIIEDSLRKLENSKLLYRQAENLLLEELKIDSVGESDKIGFVVKLSEIKENNRCDAEYFQPKYEKIVKHIKKNCGGVALGELVVIKKGIEPGAEEYLAPFDAEAVGDEKGKQFIRVSSLSKFGVNDNDQKYLSEELYQKLKADFEPKKGEILLTKDASPGIAYVLKEEIEGIVAGGILRLKMKNPSTSSGHKMEVEDEYLALCINSIVGQMQVERDAGGSVIAHWRPEQVKNILIPILSKPIQQKISDLIRQSYASRKKTKELLEEAKRKVEELIEKGGA